MCQIGGSTKCNAHISRRERKRVVHPVTYEKNRCAALLQLRGVQQGDEGVKLREAVNDIVTAEIYWGLELNLLADSIEDLSVEGLAFAVKEQSGNRIVIKVIAKP